MPSITPLFHNLVRTQFCNLYLCVYKKKGNANFFFGMSCLPNDDDNPPDLTNEEALKICHTHIADFDAVELRDFDTQTSPVKGCDVKSYLSNHYPELVISEASKDGKSVGWWMSNLDYEDEAESCIPLVSVKPLLDDKAEKFEEKWFDSCIRFDKKLRKKK